MNTNNKTRLMKILVLKQIVGSYQRSRESNQKIQDRKNRFASPVIQNTREAKRNSLKELRKFEEFQFSA